MNLLATATAAVSTGFISRRGYSLLDGGGIAPYRAVGVNAYWLGLDENEGGIHFPIKFRITDGLSTIADDWEQVCPLSDLRENSWMIVTH
jgi:hypothetical protein